MKRTFFISSFCIITIALAYVYRPKFEVIPTMAVPVSNRVIIIDAGHGTPDERCSK